MNFLEKAQNQPKCEFTWRRRLKQDQYLNNKQITIFNKIVFSDMTFSYLNI